MEFPSVSSACRLFSLGNSKAFYSLWQIPPAFGIARFLYMPPQASLLQELAHFGSSGITHQLE